jgi:hypothetical protein
MILWFTTLLPRHWMSVIESNESLAVWSMERERIIETVRLVVRFGHTRDDKSDPMVAL